MVMTLEITTNKDNKDPYVDAEGFRPYYYLWFNKETNIFPIRGALKKARNFKHAYKNILDVRKNGFPVDNAGIGSYTLIRDMKEVAPELAARCLLYLHDNYDLNTIYPYWVDPETYLNYLTPNEQKYYFHYMQILHLNFPKGLPIGTLEIFLKMIQETNSIELTSNNKQS